MKIMSYEIHINNLRDKIDSHLVLACFISC